MKISPLQTFALILSLVCQGSLADTGFCEMPMTSSLSEIHASMDDHSNHDMAMGSDQAAEHNCCAAYCECLAFSCQLAFSINNRALNLSHIKSQLFDFSSSSISLGIYTSIDRPPILA